MAFLVGVLHGRDGSGGNREADATATHIGFGW